MPQLLIENVVKAYDTQLAVDHVSFEVNGGEVFGLLGPNGAGKSTLIRMAMDILRPDSGRILVNGRPSTDADLASYRVYRQGPDGARERVGEVTPPETSWRDTTAAPGARYVYTVTTVDTAGNESKPSAAAPGGRP